MYEKTTRTRDPAIRSNLYKLLSIGFRYPTPGIFKTLQNGKFLDELMSNISAIPELNAFMTEHSLMVDDEKEVMKGMTLAELNIRFTRTFDTGKPVPSCSPYEGHYCAKPRSMIMLEVSEFYNFFGLRMSQEEGKREFPDYICAELEFMHFLTFKEGEALGEGKEEKLYLTAQRDFLERHMIQWVPKFCLKLQNSEFVPFYAGLARIASGFITCEFKLLTGNVPKSDIL